MVALMSLVVGLGIASPGDTTYRTMLTVTSDLPVGNVPMSATIDFGAIVRDHKLPGVFDPNSIEVMNVATKTPVPFARTEDFAYGDRGRLQWVISNPKHLQFEIRFRTAAKRPALRPQAYTPAVGVGDLLRYNAGPNRPITLFNSVALVDLTGDGQQDLVGCWNYAYRPGDPWSGVVCYPRLDNSRSVEFGDLIRPRYAKTPSALELHKFGGEYYVSAAFADFAYQSRLGTASADAPERPANGRLGPADSTKNAQPDTPSLPRPRSGD